MDIWDDIKKNGEQAIQRLVTNRVQEGVELELKRKKDPSNGSFDREDQKNFGRALSAFSNSGGGVLIWGVDCRRDSVGIDRAESLNPINSVEIFYSEAGSLVGSFLSPKNDLIELACVKTSQDSTQGYVAVKIPRSDRRPHRSEVQGDKQYFKRVGTSSYAMEHYDVEDAFKRTVTAKLTVELTVVNRGGGASVSGSYAAIHVILSLRNNSQSSAIYPFLSIETVRGALIDEYGLDGNGNTGLPRRNRSSNAFDGGSQFAIHPMQSIDVAALKCRLLTDPSCRGVHPSDYGAQYSFVIADHSIEVGYSVGSLNSPIEHGLVVISNEQIKLAL